MKNHFIPGNAELAKLQQRIAELERTEQQHKKTEAELKAVNQQLDAANQQLAANEQQLRAANQQLEANEQQLRAANQQLVASEIELLKSNETLKKYLDVAAEIVVLLDKDGKITLLNESGHRILGYNPGELIGKNWFETCLPEEEGANVKEHLEKLMQQGVEGFDQHENEIITKTGGRKTILWHNTLFNDDDGNYSGTLSSGEDITERKKAEQKLIESEERFRKAQEAGHIGSWEYNLQTEEFWGSDEGKRIYNLDLNKKEFPAEEVMNLVVEKDRDKVNQAMIDLVTGNKSYDIIFEITPKNTTERKTIHSKAELQKDENDLPHKVTGVLRDITMQERLEKQLIDAKEKAEEHEAILQAALDNSQAGIAIAEVPDGKLRYVNKAALMIRDKDYKDIAENIDINKYVSSWQILHFDGTPYKPEKVPLARAVLTGESVREEFIIRKDNNEDRYVLAHAAPINNDKGKRIAAIVVFLDITERKLAEQKIKDSEEKHRALYLNAPLSYQSLNINGEVKDVNPQWLRTLGYEKEQVVGKWFGDFLQTDSKEKFRKNFAQFKKKGSITGVEFNMLQNDGTEIIVSFEGCIGYDEKGNFRQTYCTFKDITE